MAGKTRCLNCGRESTVISRGLGLCGNCIKKDFEKVLPKIEETHASTRERFDLPKTIPKSSPGIPPAAKTLFVKRVLDSQKLFIQGQPVLQSFNHPTPLVSLYFLISSPEQKISIRE